ncbi:MFS transporter [Pseudomonas psychrophila]|uniref:MFS transporter n=1 Tax=Pseudomonas psychrophila TaxID=122355 RepID=UPI0002EDE2E2|nr:MFS transporter [Pseudomonas psychrophila]
MSGLTVAEKTSHNLPPAVFVLTLGVFVLGTCEFMMMGLLPNMASELGVSIPMASWVVTAYALGIAIGGPIMTVMTSKLSRKSALIVLMGLFVIGNVMCAFAATYSSVITARVLTSLGQGAFFGVGAVMVASLVPEHRKASAIAAMFLGLTLATVAGVPLGTALGNWEGWRTPFWVIAGLGVVSLMGLIFMIPTRTDDIKPNFKTELSALKDRRIWAALATTILLTACAFPLFTYIVPMLQGLLALSPAGVTSSLFIVGIGMTIGNYLGGRLADWNVNRALIVIAIAIAVVSLALCWTSTHLIPAQINWFLWGIVTFAAIPASQVSVMRFGAGAPNLVSTLNISAFNVGVALGAWIGGLVLSWGYSLIAIPLTAAVVALVASLAAIICVRVWRKV